MRVKPMSYERQKSADNGRFLSDDNIKWHKSTTKHNKNNKQKLTLIWSYSYDPRSGNEAAPFGDQRFDELCDISDYYQKLVPNNCVQ